MVVEHSPRARETEFHSTNAIKRVFSADAI